MTDLKTVQLGRRAIDPPGQARQDLDILIDMARRLGLEDAYSEGRDEKEWVAWALGRYRDTRFPELPSLEQMEDPHVPIEQMAFSMDAPDIDWSNDEAVCDLLEQICIDDYAEV